MDWSYQCLDYQCRAKPGELHNHEVLSQEMLELSVIRSECLLRILSHCPKETILQSIESILSSWPHKLSFNSSFIKSKITPFLRFYRNRAKNDEGFIPAFLAKFGEEVAHFRHVVLQFRAAPVPQGQFLK